MVWHLCLLRDQDLAEALDSGGSDMEMESGLIRVQENSAQHKAKMWKVRRATGVSWQHIKTSSFTYNETDSIV